MQHALHLLKQQLQGSSLVQKTQSKLQMNSFPTVISTEQKVPGMYTPTRLRPQLQSHHRCCQLQQKHK